MFPKKKKKQRKGGENVDTKDRIPDSLVKGEGGGKSDYEHEILAPGEARKQKLTGEKGRGKGGPNHLLAVSAKGEESCEKKKREKKTSSIITIWGKNNEVEDCSSIVALRKGGRKNGRCPEASGGKKGGGGKGRK